MEDFTLPQMLLIPSCCFVVEDKPTGVLPGLFISPALKPHFSQSSEIPCVLVRRV